MTKATNSSKTKGIVWIQAILLGAFAQAMPLSSMAATVPLSPSQVHVTSTSTGPKNLNLNLASTRNSVSASRSGTITIGGHLSTNGTVTGGRSLSVSAGQHLTPAMNAALWQSVIGAQHLVLTNTGAATGGTDKLSSTWASGLTSLVIPAGVSVNAIGFNTTNPLNVSGSAKVNGSLYALQTSAGQSAALNFGGSLTVGSSGLISTSLPQHQSLPGLVASQGLNLNVAGDLHNSGKINSSGTMNLNVAGNLNNTGSGANISAQNLNLTSGSGSIVNSGTLSAVNAVNINTTIATTNLFVNNTGGTIAAGLNPVIGAVQSGAMNLRSNGQDVESADITVLGGTLDAPGGVNMFGKNMTAQVDQIIGPVNNTGSAAHLSVNSGNLEMGDQNLTGDPTYYSTNGSVTVGNLSNINGNIIIVASQDVNFSHSPLLTTISTTANNSIFIGAGLNFTASPSNSQSMSYGDGSGGTASTTLNNFSAGSGNINGGASQFDMQTSGSGTITLVASANGVSGEGQVNMGNGSTIVTNGSGNILIIGEGGVNIGSHPSGGTVSTATGNVAIASASFSMTGLSFGTSGATITNPLTSSSIGAVTNSVSVGPSSFSGVSTTGGVLSGSVDVRAKSGISIGAFLYQNDPSPVTLSTQSGGITWGGVSTNGTVTVQSDDFISLYGAITTPQQVTIKTSYLFIADNGNGGVSGSSISIVNSPNNLNSDLTINSGANFHSTNGPINITSTPGYSLNIFTQGHVGTQFTSTFGSITLTAVPSSSRANGVNFFDDAFNIQFNSPTVVQASGQLQSIYVSSGATVGGTSNLNLESNSLVLQGSLYGNQLIFSPGGIGTIVNTSTSSLNLSTAFPLGLHFNGTSLAILSQGNIISSKAITIDLSNPAGGFAGQLTMLAGFTAYGGVSLPDTLQPANQITQGTLNEIDFSNLINVASINIPNVSINTSSGSGGTGGNVFIAASGSVTVGPINTSTSQFGTANQGGQVQIIGNGINVGSITTVGTVQSGAVQINSGLLSLKDPPGSHGFNITNGIMYNGFLFPGSPRGNIVLHNINAGTNGNVTLTTGGVGRFLPAARTAITCGNLSALNGTGNISLHVNATSLNLSGLGHNSIPGTLTTHSATSINITDSVRVTIVGVPAIDPITGLPNFYNVGSLKVTDPAGITVSGLATIGTLTLNSTALSTASVANPISFAGAKLSVNGNATVTDSGLLTGDTISIDNTSTLTGNISFNGVQGLQINGTQMTAGTLHLTSSKGPITIGDNTKLSSTTAMSLSAPIGGIVFGANTQLTAGGTPVNLSTGFVSLIATRFTSNLTSRGSLTISAGTGGISSTGTGDKFTVNGGSMKVSAASAAGIAFGDGTTIDVNGGSLTISNTAGGVLIGTPGASTASTILVRQLNNALGSVSITGFNAAKLAPLTVINAGGALTITSTASLLFPTADLDIGAGAQVNAHQRVTLSAQGSQSSLTVEGSVNSGVTFTDPNAPAGAGSLTITAKGTSTIKDSLNSNSGNVTINSTGAFSAQDGSSIDANKGSVSISSITSQAFGSALGTGASVTATEINTVAGGAITLSAPITSSIGSLTINGTSSFQSDGAMTLTGGKTGAITVGDGATLKSGQKLLGNMTLTSKGLVTIGSGTAGPHLSTGALLKSAITIKGITGVTLDSASSIISNGNLSITSTGVGSLLTINGAAGVTLSAGELNNNPSPPNNTGNLVSNSSTKPILVNGTLTLKAPVVTFNSSSNSLTSNGGNVEVIATVGTLTTGANNTFSANGGNVQLLAKTNVNASAGGDQFNARSVGDPLKPTLSLGGSVEIGSGLVVSVNDLLALKSAPTSASTISTLALKLGSPTINLTAPTLGVLKVTTTGLGSITLGGSTLNFNNPAATGTNQGGAQVFDALGSTSVTCTGCIFNTAALKPIAMTTVLGVDDEQYSVAHTFLQQDESGATTVSSGDEIAVLQLGTSSSGKNMLVPISSEQGQTLAFSNTRQSAKIYSSPRAKFVHHSDGTIALHKGEIFVDALRPVELRSEGVTILASGGGMVSLKSQQGNTYVRACSGAGTVTVNIEGAIIRLNTGEELMVTPHKPDVSELQPGDGIGRRNRHSSVVGSHYLTVSDFAIISMLSNSGAVSGIRHSMEGDNKRLLARLLKTAATVDVVLKYRGAYEAAN